MATKPFNYGVFKELNTELKNMSVAQDVKIDLYDQPGRIAVIINVKQQTVSIDDLKQIFVLVHEKLNYQNVSEAADEAGLDYVPPIAVEIYNEQKTLAYQCIGSWYENVSRDKYHWYIYRTDTEPREFIDYWDLLDG